VTPARVVGPYRSCLLRHFGVGAGVRAPTGSTRLKNVPLTRWGRGFPRFANSRSSLQVHWLQKRRRLRTLTAVLTAIEPKVERRHADCARSLSVNMAPWHGSKWRRGACGSEGSVRPIPPSASTLPSSFPQGLRRANSWRATGDTSKPSLRLSMSRRSTPVDGFAFPLDRTHRRDQ
jgi:hypothetical protein